MYNKTEQEIMKNWKGDIANPVVSVCTITYNHGMFISEAIDSFLMQETDFPFEVIIGEDCGRDNTAKIVREYADQYPNIIKATIREKNIGINANFLDIILKAKGEFIALCEGDDYWTDSNKLQIQIDFLKSNQEFSGSGHQARVVGLNTEYHQNTYRLNVQDILYRKDFMRDVPFQTASFIFRTSIVKKYAIPTNIISGDKALMLLVSSFGPIKYYNQIMSSYRKHEGGVSGNVTMEMMKKDLNIIQWMIKIDPKFPKYQYLSYIHETISQFPVDLNVFFFIKHFSLSIIYSFSYFPKNLLFIVKKFIKRIINY